MGVSPCLLAFVFQRLENGWLRKKERENMGLSCFRGKTVRRASNYPELSIPLTIRV
jgi:hypothetical protein